MGSTGLFSDTTGAGATPVSVQERSARREPLASEPEPLMPSSKAHTFDADVDMCEVDDRDRPGPAWTAKAKQISRSSIVLRSRRMCYVSATVLVAIHLIDAEPVILYGKVRQCDYDGDGLYRLDVDLLPMPDKPTYKAWMA